MPWNLFDIASASVGIMIPAVSLKNKAGFLKFTDQVSLFHSSPDLMRILCVYWSGLVKFNLLFLSLYKTDPQTNV